jgi:hypothetical protein
MLSNKLECLSNSVSTSNPAFVPISSLASNSRDPNVTECQTSNLMAPSSLLNITAETPQAPSEQVQVTAVVPSSSETQLPCIEISATTPSPSETQVPRNEQVTSLSPGETQAPRNEQVTSLSPGKTQAPRNEQVTSLSPGETQAPCNNQVGSTVAVPSAPVKKSVKMRPGSSNTPRQAIIPFSSFLLKLSLPISGACVL